MVHGADFPTVAEQRGLNCRVGQQPSGQTQVVLAGRRLVQQDGEPPPVGELPALADRLVSNKQKGAINLDLERMEDKNGR